VTGQTPRGHHSRKGQGERDPSGLCSFPGAGLLRGGDYALRGGFWAPRLVVEGSYAIYLPIVLRSGP
jgi:hypothetical protein